MITTVEAAEFRSRYNLDDFWRTGWNRFANKPERNRLQTKQEYIERRANMANRRIGKLMRDYDLIESQN